MSDAHDNIPSTHPSADEAAPKRRSFMDESNLLDSIAEIERQLRHTQKSKGADELAFASLCVELVRARESRDTWELSWEEAQAEARETSVQLDKARNSLTERAQQIEILQAKADASGSELENSKLELETTTKRLDAALSKYGAVRLDLETAESERASAQHELEQAHAQLASTKSEHDAVAARIADLERELEDARRVRESSQSAIDEANEARESVRRDLETLQDAYENAKARAQTLQAAVDEAHRDRAETVASRDALIAERDEAQRQLGSLRDTHESTKAALDAVRSEIEASQSTEESVRAAQESIKAERDAALGELETLRATLASIQAETETLTGRTAEATDELETLREAVAKATTERDEANAEHAATREAMSALVDSHEALEAELTALRTQVEDARADDGDAKLAYETAIRERDDARAEREAAQEELKTVLEDFELAQLEREEADHAAPSLGHVDIDFLATRKKRLSAYRQMIARESQKLIDAEILLQRRMESTKTESANDSELRKALAEREQQLGVARQKLDRAVLAIKQLEAQAQAQKQAPRPTVKAAPRTRLLPAMSLVCFGLSALAVVSWHFAGQFADSVHLAEMRIASEAPASTLSEAQTAAWLEYHETLFEDPQVIGLAAERLKRRGLLSVAEPSALRERLAENLDVMRLGDTTLSLTLRGEGEAPTRRLLETYVLTLVSFANDTRDYREDASATVVTAGASVDADALETNRLELFAIIAGAITLLSGLIAMVLARISKPVAAPVRAVEHAEIDLPDAGDVPITRV